MNAIKRNVFFLIIILFVICQNSFAKDLYGGIEIGSKGVKISIIDMQNLKKNQFEIKEFWTENVGIAKGISIDGNLAQADIDAASIIVLNNYRKLLDEYKIEDSKIFIVASSGVGMAKNTDDLITKIKSVTNKDIEVISSRLESKLSFRGCIPQAKLLNSVLVDIGGGNTKGGYAGVANDNNIFFPVNLDFGTITLTEKMNKKTRTPKVSEFIEVSFNYLPTLRTDIQNMYQERPLCKEKKNVYMSGGAVWAFYTLYNEGAPKDNFPEFKLEEVQEYNAYLQNNFKKFEELALTNKDVEKVLKTYPQKNLISANNLLIIALEELGDLDKKKIFFVKEGQVAWLLSYIAESAKGSKVIY